VGILLGAWLIEEFYLIVWPGICMCLASFGWRPRLCCIKEVLLGNNFVG